MRAIHIVVIGAMLSACAGTPSFNHPRAGIDAPPTVATLIHHIECEVLQVQMDWQKPNGHLAEYQQLVHGHYVASATLTADVTNFEGTSPALSYITPYKTSGTSLSDTLSGQVTGTQHRTMTQTFYMQLDFSDPARLGKCSYPLAEGKGIQGDLGLASILLAGVRNASALDLPFDTPGSKVNNPPTKATSVPVTGTTVDFTVVYGLGGSGGLGPNWTLTKFKGPGTGLLSLTRTQKDTLVISFAPSCPGSDVCKKGGGPQDHAPAHPVVSQPQNKADLETPDIKLPKNATASEKANFQVTQKLLAATSALKGAVDALSAQADVSSQQLEYAQQTQQQLIESNTMSAEAAALKAAQDNNTRMILQNLLP